MDDFLVVTMLLGNKSHNVGNVGKAIYSPIKGGTFVRKKWAVHDKLAKSSLPTAFSATANRVQHYLER